MSNYTKTTDFEAKDSLPTGDSGKIIRGSEFETEFDAISTAIGTKADTAGPTFTGTLTFETISDGTIGVTAFVDEDDMSSNSATLVPTQQSVKAYVDSQVTAQDLDFQADTGGALSIDLDSETMTFTGGTGIDTSGSGNAVTFAIDSTVATLTGSQTLTNKTLTSPVLNTGVSGTAVLDEDNMASNSATQLATQQSIKAYVDSQVGANNELSEILTNGNTTGGTNIVFGDSSGVSNDRLVFGAGSDLQIYHSGSHSYIDDAGTGNLTLRGNASVRVEKYEGEVLADFAADGAVSLYHDNSVKIATTSTGVNVTGTVEFDGLSGTGSVNVTDILDQDDMSSNSATALATQQSIKAYVDSQVATADTLSEVLANGNTTGGTDIAVGTGDDVTFADSSKAIFGAGSDLQIYHDGSDSYIKDAGTGDLIIQASDDLRLQTASGTNMAVFTENTYARLFYNGTARFETTNTGIDVTGVITTDGMTTSADINFGDNDKAVFGAGNDLQIYHDGATSIITDQGTGFLALRGDGNVSLQNAAGTENKLVASTDGAVTAYYDNAAKLATTSTGIDVTGTVTADGLTVAGGTKFSGSADESSSGGLSLKVGLIDASISNSTDSFIGVHDTGGLGSLAGDLLLVPRSSTGVANSIQLFSGQTTPKLRQKIADNGDISFYEDTGTTAKLFWDASAESLGIGTTALTSNATLSVAQGGVHVDGGASGGASQVILSTGASSGSNFGQISNTGTRWALGYGGTQQTVGTEVLTWNSSNNVGIGTTSPLTLLHVNSSTTTSQIRVTNSTGTSGFDLQTSGNAAYVYNRNNGPIIFGTNATERARLDASGNVGIGTSSPSQKLHVAGGQARFDDHISIQPTKKLYLDGGLDTYIDEVAANTIAFNGGGAERMRIDSSGAVLIHPNNATRGLKITSTTTGTAGDTTTYDTIAAGFGRHVFKTDGTERARIDQSGNFLVGKASSGSSTVGFETSSNGQTISTTNGASSLILNRKTSDGTIADFRKDGTSVGNIGCDSNSNFMLGQGDTGLSFQPSSDRIIPRNTDGSGRDAAIDLGGTGNQFKDLYLSGVAYNGDGSASAPSISFGADTNTGFYRVGSDQIGFVTAGSLKAKLDSSGNLLVGTTNTLPGVGNTVAGISLYNDGRIFASKSANTTMSLNRSTSDGAIAEFRKDGSTVGSIQSRSGAVTTMVFDPRSNGSGITGTTNGLLPTNQAGTPTDNHVDLGSSSNRFKDLYLSGAVNVGGGIQNSIPTNSGFGYVNFGDADDANIGQILYDHDSNYMRFQINNQERARIDASGNLLVGTTSTTDSAVFSVFSSGTAASFRTTPTTATSLIIFRNGNGLVGSISTSGSATAFNTSSDQRLKDNIVDAPSASNDIDAIQVRSFDWKADGSHQKYGMVAQELQTVAPEAVSQGETEEDMMGVDYSKLVPMMMKEIQSLRARVAQLEGEN